MSAEDLLGKSCGLGSGSNNIIVWIIVLVVIFGFGKGRSMCNPNFAACEPEEKECCSSHHRHHKHSSDCDEKEPVCCNNGIGGAGIGNLFGNNGLFILIIIGLIFLCKDKKPSTSTTD